MCVCVRERDKGYQGGVDHGEIPSLLSENNVKLTVARKVRDGRKKTALLTNSANRIRNANLAPVRFPKSYAIHLVRCL